MTMIVSPHVSNAVSPLLLDLLSTSPKVAYSTRKLRAAYVGPALEAKRPSDNATTDIGFVGKHLDLAALADFVGAQTCTARFYDQSPNADHTSGVWPDITLAGTPYNINGRTALNFSGNDRIYATTAGISGTTLSALIVAAITSNDRIVVVGTLNDGADYSAPNAIVLIGGSGSLYNYRNSTSGPSVASTSGVPFQAYSYFNGSQMGLVVNGTAGTPVNTSGTISGEAVTIGGSLNNTNMVGKFAELIVFPDALSAPDIATARADQQDYWGTA